MQKVDNLRIGIGLDKFALRENIIKMIVTGKSQIFQTTKIERLNKVITCTFHKRCSVWVLTGKHIRKVDT